MKKLMESILKRMGEGVIEGIDEDLIGTETKEERSSLMKTFSTSNGVEEAINNLSELSFEVEPFVKENLG